MKTIINMNKMSVKESSLYYQEMGSGEPLVLIAGLASDSQSWLPVVVQLSKHFRVIIFDNRGVGRSPAENENITIQKMTDDCVSLMKYLNLSSANILGHSMGGMIAMDMAARYPKLVDKLILEATAPKISMRNIELFNDWVEYLKSGMEKELWFRNVFYWIFSPAFFNDKEMVNQAVSMSINYRYPQSDISFENQVNSVSLFDYTSEISNIQASTLIIYGQEDLLFSESETDDLFRNLTNSKTVIIPKAAHSIHMDNPQGFIDAVVEFLLD